MANQFQLVAARLFELSKLFRYQGDSENLNFKLLALEPGIKDLPNYEDRVEELRSEWYDLDDPELQLLDEADYLALRLLMELMTLEERRAAEGEKR